MKNLLLIWQITLTIAVIILFFLYINQPSASTNPQAAAKPALKPSGKKIETKTVFVNTDTLMLNYDFYKKIKKELEAKQNGIDADLGARANSLQNEITSYQKTAYSMTQQKAAETEKTLGLKQQELEMYRADIAKKYLDDEKKMNEKLYDNISEFLKRYAEANNYEYVVGYSKVSGSILYGTEKLEVTKDVLKGLNEEYNKKK